MVLYWCEFSIRVGGVLVKFTDVPVVQGHDGILLGNDFLLGCHGEIKYLRQSRDGVHFDGTFRMCDEEGCPISEMVPIYCTPPKEDCATADVNAASQDSVPAGHRAGQRVART